MAALVLVLETTIDSSDGAFDFNTLRTKLGLPEAGPIDPGYDRKRGWRKRRRMAGASAMAILPLMRLARLQADKLSDELLLEGYRRAVGFPCRQGLA